MITLASLLGMDVLGFFNLQRRPQETVVHKHKIMYCTMLVRVLRTIGLHKEDTSREARPLRTWNSPQGPN